MVRLAVSTLLLLLVLVASTHAARETELAQQALGRVEKAVEQAAAAVHVDKAGLPADVIADVVQKVTQAEVEKILQSSDFYSAIAKHIVGLHHGEAASSSSSSASSESSDQIAVVHSLKKDRKEYEHQLGHRIRQVKDSEGELEGKLKELQHEADLLHHIHAQLKRLTEEKSHIKGLFSHMAHRFHVHPHHHVFVHAPLPVQYVTVPAPLAPAQPTGRWEFVPSQPLAAPQYVVQQPQYVQQLPQPTMLDSQPEQIEAQPQQLVEPAQPQQLRQEQIVEPRQQYEEPEEEAVVRAAAPVHVERRYQRRQDEHSEPRADIPRSMQEVEPATQLVQEFPEAARNTHMGT